MQRYVGCMWPCFGCMWRFNHQYESLLVSDHNSRSWSFLCCS